jgi:hypothetical protein
MARLLALCLVIGLLLCPLEGFAGSAFREGVIDKDLTYEGFEIGSDGFLTGYIVNTSNAARRGVKLDMWTTNPQETRVFWRKSITIGEIAPKGKSLIKEPYDLDGENPEKIKVMFRIPNTANFRN